MNNIAQEKTRLSINKPLKPKYLKSRLKELKISNSQNRINMPINSFSKESKSHHFFEADQYGNILINYFTLHGTPSQFRRGKNKWEEKFIRKRILNPSPDTTGKINKYLSPKGSGLKPFFPPQIIKKYKNKKVIKTLFITEGEFKAFKGAMHGVDIIGVPSIHGFYDNEKSDNDKIKTLHYEIEELLKKCKVKNVVYLTDADTMVIKRDFEKEMTNRPLSFFSGAKNFRNAMNIFLQKGIIEEVYFTHINTSFSDSAKGLDDLMVKHETAIEEIVKDLYLLSKSKAYFKTQCITGKDYNVKLYKYFGLDNVNNFYERYSYYLGIKEFKFKNAIYYYNYEKVIFVRHDDTTKFMRVGGNWFKIISIINKYQEPERDIIPFPKGEIKDDYEQFKGFLKGIPKYDAFTVYPNWIDTYKEEIKGAFNLYAEMFYKPEKGDWSTTYNFLKHIFQGKAFIDKDGEENHIKGDPFSVALDYFTIQYREPTHLLPVPILVSKEQQTGKSTLLKWLNEVYKGNSTILNNEQFKMNFNRHYISKFIIGIDEAIMGADNVEAKKDKERLKQMVTADSAFIEDKGINVKKIPYYGKVLMTSNDAESIMKMDQDDKRWFVVAVPPLDESNIDPDLEIKMKKEIPAFLYFLRNRIPFHKRKTRLWFETKDFLTEQFYKIMASTKSPLEKAIEDAVKEMFFTYELDYINMHPEYLLEIINKTRSRKFQLTQIKDRLKSVYKLDMHKQNRFKIPIAWSQGIGSNENLQFADYRRRYHTYIIQDWLSEDELKELNTPKLF